MKRIIVLIAVASVVLCFIPATAMGVTTNDKDVTAYETNFIRVASLALEKDTDALLRGHCCMMIAGPEETPTPLFAPTDMKECETHSTRMLPRTNCGKTAANLYQSAGRWYDTISFYAGGGSMPQVIYVADDEKNIRQLIAAFLTQEGFQVQTFPTGDALLSACEERLPDLVVLDIMMPGIDGLEVCREIRKTSNIPILILSAKAEDMDKIVGFGTGADDYLTKPFHPLELLARVKSQMKRYTTIQLGEEQQPASKDEIEIQDLTINKAAHVVKKNGKEVALTPIEFDILYLLASNRDRVFSTDEIFEKVWNEKVYEVNNTVMVHIRRLREKIEDNSRSPKILKTVWGVGYKIEG